MLITAGMVELLLARQGFNVELRGNRACVVERVRPWQQRANEPGTLYTGRGRGPRASSLESNGCAYLRFGPCASAGSSPSPSPARKGLVDEGGNADGRETAPLARPSDNPSAPLPSAAKETASVSDAAADVTLAYEAVLALEKWESSLKDALLSGTGLEEFIALGAEMICRPIAYFDRNLITLAASADYWDRERLAGDERENALFEGQMPPSMAVDLVEDIDYLRAAERQGGFYYESAQQRMFYGVNTFDGEEYLARLVIVLAEGEQRLHRGEEQLVDVFHSFLDDFYLRYAGNAQVMSSQNDALHALVRMLLVHGEERSVDEAMAILSAFGWSYDDRYIVAKLVFFEGVHWDTASLYLCSLLERTVAGSCAFAEEKQIIWMINLTHGARLGEQPEKVIQRVMESLVSILRNYACKAGLSSVFDSFAEAQGRFLEAVRAIELGQIRDPHYWYYRFSDYAFDYLLSRCTGELSPGQFCHPALSALIAHDARYGTDYARTLVCFLRNSQNTTHAAAELYLHRTSFMRRMAHIEELASFDLNDSDQVLHLLLSAKLLGM